MEDGGKYARGMSDGDGARRMESRDWKVDDKIGAIMHGFCPTGARRFCSWDVDILNRSPIGVEDMVQDDRGGGWK